MKPGRGSPILQSTKNEEIGNPMNVNGASSAETRASSALAELFDEELRSMGGADIASVEDRLLRRGHEAMARAFGRVLERCDLRICASLPEGAGSDQPRRLEAGCGTVTILHTDQGSVCTSLEYNKVIREKGLVRSRWL